MDSIVDKYINREIIPFHSLDWEDKVRVITHFVAVDLPRVLKDWDKNRDIQKEATTRSISLNSKGRAGKAKMIKNTQNVIDTYEFEDMDENLITMSFEILEIMLRNIMKTGSDVKTNKFLRTLESRLGLETIIKTQIIVTLEALLKEGVDVKNCETLKVRLDARNKSQKKLRDLYKLFYNEELTQEELYNEVNTIFNDYQRKIMTIDGEKFKILTGEAELYKYINPEEIRDYLVGEVEIIRLSITGGQQRLEQI